MHIFSSSTIFLGVIFSIGLMLVFAYNKLVRLRNAFGNAFAQIDVQLKRRHDLIPNLVEIAKKYMAHERETLEAVISARNKASSASDSAALTPGGKLAMADLARSEGQLNAALTKFMMVAEAYPDLKADKTMSNLSEELISTENRVSFARQCYNYAVLDYNNMAEQLPGNIIAGFCGFKTVAMLTSIESEAERASFKINF